MELIETCHLCRFFFFFAGLVFSEYLLSGQAPPVKEVNDEEPLFPDVSILNVTIGDKVSYSCP